MQNEGQGDKQPMMLIIDGLLQMMEMDDLVDIMSDLAERVKLNHKVQQEPMFDPDQEVDLNKVAGALADQIIQEDLAKLAAKPVAKPVVKKSKPKPQRITVRGVVYRNVAEACKAHGYENKAATVRSRLKKGMPADDAMPLIWKDNVVDNEYVVD